MVKPMALVAIRCPNCGGTVQFEEKMNSGFCVHCGNKIVNEHPAIEQVPTDHDSKMAYYLKKAKGSLTDHDWDTADGLVNNILKLDPDCKDAWYMQALLHRRDGTSESIIEKAESGGKRDYGVFSKEDISKCWGEFDLTVKYEISKRTTLTVKTLVVIDGKDSFPLERGKSTIFGVNSGTHDITAQFIMKKGLTKGDKMSFIASKDHEFVIKTSTSGMIMVYIEPKIVQIS